MKRLLVLVMFLAAIAPLAGSIERAEPAGCCPDSCPEEDADGTCSPTCEICPFAATVRPCLEPEAQRLPFLVALAYRAEEALQAPPAPEPAEILHVPRLRLA